MSLDDIEHAAAAQGLIVMGALHPRRHVGLAETCGTLVLIGAGPGCWPIFTSAPEYFDGRADPLDRWSKRVLASLLPGLRYRCIFPSDGPPYAPFIAWALASGRFFHSPTGMMVHERAGLMISLRGALAFQQELLLPAATAEHPCERCANRPCINACPVDALSDRHLYDVPRCKAFLATAAGRSCMSEGCELRRACPISQNFDRNPAQSGFHMRAFLGEQDETPDPDASCKVRLVRGAELGS
ncbi:ferredoxin [Sulfitobacter aestuarii]|uniref:Ferredoxin n=1 Tax=Sulfitobacter aestuarii TaxID=2161676 RepID=A0ABW5TYM1_9RHOB